MTMKFLSISTFFNLPDNVQSWVDEVNKYANATTSMLLVANKSDCGEDRKVSAEEGLQKARQLGLAFLETSAKTGDL